MKTFVLPKISIITPSFNQGEYLEDTILSVLNQNYKNLEYIVMDGNSTDNSVDILRKYSDGITYWESINDNGQAHAINKGFALASGDIIGWLNSDDLYLPNALETVASIFLNEDLSIPKIAFGNCQHYFQVKNHYEGSDVVGDHASLDLRLCDYIIQPSCFWTRSTLQKVGNLNESLHYAFDWEWFIRCMQKGVKFISTDSYFSVYRIHDAHKTGTGGLKRRKEIKAIIEGYSPQLGQMFTKRYSRFDIKMLLKIASALEKRFIRIKRPNKQKNNFVFHFVYWVYFRDISWGEFKSMVRM